MKKERILNKDLKKASERRTKGLKIMSAFSMALPIFLESGTKAFADGHHYTQWKSLPSNVKIDQNSFGGRANQMAIVTTPSGATDDRHQGIHGTVDGKELRFYCLEPMKITPGQGTVSKKTTRTANQAVKNVLRVGFGANSAEEMGFPGKSSEAEYATQVAVWKAAGAISSVRWINADAHKIYNYIEKEAAKVSGNGETKLTLKVTDVDKENGTATVTPELEENGQTVKRSGTVKLTNMSATQHGKAVGKTVDANYAIKVKLTKKSTTGTSTNTDANGKTNTTNNSSSADGKNSTSQGKGDGTTSSSESSSTTLENGKITVSFKGYKLVTPIYNAQYANSQDTVMIGAEEMSKPVTKSWSFGAESHDEKHHHDEKTTPIKAMFDLKKNDDEGDQVDQAKFDVYEADSGYSPIKFIGTITTNKNGVARSGELDPGYYVAIERSTGKNLEVDKSPVHIDLTEDNLKENAKVTKVTGADGKSYDLYHLDVNGPINNHKKPQVTSLLTNLEDNTQFAQPIKGPVVLNEHLYFSHLVGTVSYNVRAWLVDKSTGQPITINGQKIEVSKTIGSPNNDNNDDGIEANTDLQLKVPDASSLAGKDVVAYSEIARSDKPDHYTSVHQDINDKNETVHFSKPSIHTNAINKETEGKKLQPTDGETIEDTVTYTELIPGKTYTLKGTVMDKETGKAVMNDGKKVEFTKTFTPTSANGEVKADVKLDVHHYRKHRLVVYESLYYTDYLLTDHRDINDVNQSLDVTSPQLHTTLSDNTQKVVSPKRENTVEDVVRYVDLIPGQTYSVRGKLMDQVTGQLVLKNGVPVISTATFKPNKANGTVTLTFVFDGTQYTGHNITAFESLYTNGRILVEHADLNDASQTVSVDNKHDNFIPIPKTPVIPTPGTGGSGVIVNNNNNNSNGNSNSGNNSSNNGSNNSGNNSSNNGSNNSGNNGSSNNESNNSGSNATNNHVVAKTTKSAKPISVPVVTPAVSAKHTVLPTATMVATPIQAATPSSNEALPTQSVASSERSLPQTGDKHDTALQVLGAAALVATVGGFVYTTRRKQTTGLD